VSNNVAIESGVLTFTLNNNGCPSGCSGQPYGAGGWETEAHFMYGTSTFVAKMAAQTGAWTELFTYNNQGGPNEGITWRFLGKSSTSVQLFFYANSAYYEMGFVNLGFDYSQSYHNYSILRSSTQLTFYVDGTQVAQATKGSTFPVLPTTTMTLAVWQLADNTTDSIYGTFTYTVPYITQLTSVSFVGSSSLPSPPARCIIGNPADT